MEEMETLKKDVKGSFVELSKAVWGALEEVCNELKGHVEASILKLSAKLDTLKVEKEAEKPSFIPKNDKKDTLEDEQRNKENVKQNKQKPHTSSPQPSSSKRRRNTKFLSKPRIPICG